MFLVSEVTASSPPHPTHLAGARAGFVDFSPSPANKLGRVFAKLRRARRCALEDAFAKIRVFIEAPVADNRSKMPGRKKYGLTAR